MSFQSLGKCSVTNEKHSLRSIGADSMGPAGLGPPQSQGPGAHHKVEPPQYFVIQKLIFMYYFNKLTQLQLDLHNVI